MSRRFIAAAVAASLSCFVASAVSADPLTSNVENSLKRLGIAAPTTMLERARVAELELILSSGERGKGHKEAVARLLAAE